MSVDAPGRAAIGALRGGAGRRDPSLGAAPSPARARTTVSPTGLATILTLVVLVAPLAARAQPAGPPTVGFFRSTPSAPFGHLVVAFRPGLADAGFVEGQNVAIEYRWAENRPERLAGLAADLVRRQVGVIVGNVLAIEAARAATSRIPLVFVSGDDPVRSGLVATLSRPGGDLTGVTFFGGGQLNAKRLELLHALVPGAAVIGVLVDPGYPGSEDAPSSLAAAAQAIGRRIVVERARSARDLEPAFARAVQAGAEAMLVSGSPLFTSERRALVAVAARHAVPTIYDPREFVASGGLISYSASITAAYRQAGLYAGRILQGATAAELPVLQPTRFELAINLKTAAALGLTVPPAILLLADEVVQ